MHKQHAATAAARAVDLSSVPSIRNGTVDLPLGPLEITPVAVVMTDTRGVIIFANRAAEKLLGRDAAAIHGQRFDAPEWDIRATDGPRIASRDLPTARALRGEIVLKFEHTIAAGDAQRPIVVVVCSLPVRDDDDRIIGALATFTHQEQRAPA